MRRPIRRHSHPGLDRAGTNLSYCNGEFRAGSSNIKLYMLWPCPLPLPVAHKVQHVASSSGRKDEVGEPREQDKASATRSTSAIRILLSGSCYSKASCPSDVSTKPHRA